MCVRCNHPTEDHSFDHKFHGNVADNKEVDRSREYACYISIYVLIYVQCIETEEKNEDGERRRQITQLKSK